MAITERQNLILDKIIEEYITSAQPVSSQWLEKKYNFGISPATIRIEMQKLTETGFLYQPHTSAGRVPTDKGYRFFVDELLKKELVNFENIFKIGELLQKEREDTLRFISYLTKFLAQTTSDLATVYLFEKKFFWKEGWEEVLQEPEFKDKDFVSNFAKLLENFEKNIEELKINSKIKIYIGKESPFPKARDFSIISAKCYLPDGQGGILSLLGPKRMAYDKNISLINSLTRLLEEL